MNWLFSKQAKKNIDDIPQTGIEEEILRKRWLSIGYFQETIQQIISIWETEKVDDIKELEIIITNKIQTVQNKTRRAHIQNFRNQEKIKTQGKIRTIVKILNEVIGEYMTEWKEVNQDIFKEIQKNIKNIEKIIDFLPTYEQEERNKTITGYKIYLQIN